MGYTHHWYKRETVTDDDPRWKKVAADARQLIARSETPLSAGLAPDFTDPPVVEKDQVVIDEYRADGRRTLQHPASGPARLHRRAQARV